MSIRLCRTLQCDVCEGWSEVDILMLYEEIEESGVGDPLQGWKEDRTGDNEHSPKHICPDCAGKGAAFPLPPGAGGEETWPPGEERLSDHLKAKRGRKR